MSTEIILPALLALIGVTVLVLIPLISHYSTKRDTRTGVYTPALIVGIIVILVVISTILKVA